MMEGYNRQLVGLYRARPYTKSIPFNVTVNNAGVFPLWSPKNGYFEFNRMYIISNTAAIDFNLVDTNVDNVFGMVVPETAKYTLVDFGTTGWRSLLASNAVLGIVDPLATGARVRGFILGWEVTMDGNYR